MAKKIDEAEMTYGVLRHSRSAGCPACDGIDAENCADCHGKTRQCDWLLTASGWKYLPVGSIYDSLQSA